MPPKRGQKNVSVLEELDRTAKADLLAADLPGYFEYRDHLLAEGIATDDINDILRGYIWNLIKAYD